MTEVNISSGALNAPVEAAKQVLTEEERERELPFQRDQRGKARQSKLEKEPGRMSIKQVKDEAEF